MRKSIILFLSFMLLLSFSSVFAQNTLDDTHLFQSFFHDATIAKTPYGEGGLVFNDYEYGSSFRLGAQGGYGVNPNLEIGGNLGFINFSPEEGDGTSGLTDLLVAGRYLLSNAPAKIAAGGYVTLPIGSEDAGQGNLNFGAMGAMRYPLENGMVVTASLGIDFMETTKMEVKNEGGVDWVNGELVITEAEYDEKTEYENSLRIAGGVIYPVNELLNVVGELVIKTEGDYMMLSGGADYQLEGLGKVRGALGLGLDDGAPDFSLMASYLMNF